MRTILNISLPEAIAMEIKQFAKKYGFSSVSEYIRHLVREEKKRQFENELLLERIGFEQGKAKTLRSLKDLR
jgi:Arc/MetJ-type ribon-helix-helix transcriptional regulator